MAFLIRGHIKEWGLAGCVLVALVSTAAVRGDGRATETYFGCETGYAFEVNNQAARCRRAASVLAVAPVECPATGATALSERVDYNGRNDACVGASAGTTVTVERSCPTDYTRRVLAGPDRCERAAPESIKAPNVPVLR
jgi:hypothetical protein